MESIKKRSAITANHKHKYIIKLSNGKCKNFIKKSIVCITLAILSTIAVEMAIKGIVNLILNIAKYI